MLPLGTPAPDFRLQDVTTGEPVSRDDFAESRGLLVMFLCRHCPFVKHIQAKLAEVANEYRGRGVGVVAIGSNDAVKYPQDGPDGLREMAAELGFEFPYLFDETQEVARAYSAACTPDFFLFDGDKRLVYRGQFDSSRPSNDVPVTGEDLSAAMEAVLQGRPVPEEQRPSVGCSIKWKEPVA